MTAEATTTRRAPRRLVIARGYRYTCRQCGDCCRGFPVQLTDAEAARYAARDWTPLLGPGAGPVHERTTYDGRPGTFLRRKASDASCVLLDPAGLCLIHSHLGEAEKPMVCRLYPFTFSGGADGRVAASASFSCSATAAGEGEPLANRKKTLEGLLEEVEAVHPLAPPPGPVVFEGRLAYGRGDLEQVLDLLGRELEDAGRPFPERLVAATKFASLLAGSRLPTLEGETPRRMVNAFAAGIHDQAQRGLLRPPWGHPSLNEKIIFRQLVAFAARRAPASLLRAGPTRRLARRLGNVLAGLAFMAGNGVVQPVGRDRRVAIAEVRRRAPSVDLASPEADGALTRYLVGHLSARTVLDRSFAVREFVPALGLLFRQVPMVVLFARAACLARGGERLERDDWASALRTAEWNFGRAPWTFGFIGKLRARILGDVEASLTHLWWCGVRPDEATAPPAGQAAPPPAPPAAQGAPPAAPEA